MKSPCILLPFHTPMKNKNVTAAWAAGRKFAYTGTTSDKSLSSTGSAREMQAACTLMLPLPTRFVFFSKVFGLFATVLQACAQSKSCKRMCPFLNPPGRFRTRIYPYIFSWRFRSSTHLAGGLLAAGGWLHALAPPKSGYEKLSFGQAWFAEALVINETPSGRLKYSWP